MSASYWNPNNPINIPNTITVGTPMPLVDPQVRIANALERIAFALETANQRKAVTVTTTPARKSVIRRVKSKRRAQ